VPGELSAWLTSHRAAHDRTEIAKDSKTVCLSLETFSSSIFSHVVQQDAPQPEENLFLQDLGGMVFSKESVLKLCKHLLILGTIKPKN